MTIDAEEFFAKMERPVPGDDQRLLAQERLVVQPPAPPPAPAPQTPEATQRAPDGQDDGLSIHEQRNQRQEEMAEALYGGTPMDGVRYDEPELTSPNEFALEVPEDLRLNLGEGEAEAVVGAFIESGVGRTFALDLVRQGVEASRRGPLADADIERRNAAGMRTLSEKWGDKAGAKIELARGMINAAEAKWPGVKAYLNATGLGSEPRLIQQLVARAERRPGRK